MPCKSWMSKSIFKSLSVNKMELCMTQHVMVASVSTGSIFFPHMLYSRVSYQWNTGILGFCVSTIFFRNFYFPGFLIFTTSPFLFNVETRDNLQKSGFSFHHLDRWSIYRLPSTGKCMDVVAQESWGRAANRKKRCNLVSFPDQVSRNGCLSFTDLFFP